MLGSLSRAVVEGMSTNSYSVETRRVAYSDMVAGILAFVISILIIAFAGQWLWNEVICSLFEFAKPARSIWMLVGLKLFIVLMMP